MSLIKHLLGRAIFPPRYAWFLEGPWRRLVLSPDRLRHQLVLSREMTVLEIGAGGGYYARPLAHLVRRFIALDVQQAMLNRLRKKSTAQECFPVQGDAADLPLADGSVDLVIAVTVLGEVASPERAIAEARRVLRPGGSLSVSEHWPDPDFLPLTYVNSLCRKSGLRLENRYGVRYSYSAIFRATTA